VDGQSGARAFEIGVATGAVGASGPSPDLHWDGCAGDRLIKGSKQTGLGGFFQLVVAHNGTSLKEKKTIVRCRRGQGTNQQL